MSDSNGSTAPPVAEEGVPSEFEDAVARFVAGQSVVVIAEADNGSASQLVRLLPEGSLFARVDCAPTCMATVGEAADSLRIDQFGGGAVVLENAQWADPTSLGHLQRLVREQADPLLLVLVHRPLSGVDSWGIDQVANTARRHAALVELTLEAEQVPVPRDELDSQAVDLIVGTSLVTGPISVALASKLLDMSEVEILELGETLVEQGWLSQERGGYSSVSGRSSDAGDARIGYVADRLATGLEEAGGKPAVIGELRLSAGQPSAAYPLLAEAARDAESRHAVGEAFHLAESALQAAVDAGLPEGRDLGELHLICGRFLRSAGRTEWAKTHVEKASTLLEGVERIDALGFAAAVADDGQRPQEAERIIAMAEWEAARLGESAKLGSLSTFRARTLSRIGFAEEADASLIKGQALLEQGSSPIQRFHGNMNKAWIHFDRGEASLAEAEFTQLRDEAGPLEGDVSVADKEAWRARALFASGHPSEALEAIAVVEEIAAREDAEAPLFLAQLALTEGNLAYGRYEEALAAAERVLDLVERQLPAWENAARAGRAEAYLRLGRIDEAREEIAKALEASPPGVDGWRWRIRCQALQMEIATESGDRWPARDAEDLADLMLQSRFYGWAAELLCAIAERGKRAGAAEEAMGVAVYAGLPMVAARAAQAGSLWRDPAAAPAVRGIQAISQRLPSGWESDWRALPHVAGAMEAPEPIDSAEVEVATAAMEEALRKAGLAGDDVVLSPAQRRSKGLVRRPRVLRPLQLVAAGLAVIALAGGTAFAVVAANSEDPPPATTAPPVVGDTTVPEPLALEETQIALPEGIEIVAGTAEHRGGYERAAFFDVEGPRDVNGFYWKYVTDSPIEAAPVASGQNLIVASRDGTIYAINMTTGGLAYPAESPEGTIVAAPALGQADFGEGPLRPMMVVGDNDGVVRAYRSDSGQQTWSTELAGTRIRSSPVIVDGVAYVATTAGFIHSFSLTGNGEILSTYPAEGDGIGLIEADLAYSAGFLYVGTDEGLLHVLSVSGAELEEVCAARVGSSITVPPVIVGDAVYVPTVGQQVLTYRAGTCESPPPDREPIIFVEAPMDEAVAVADGGAEAEAVLYTAADRFLNSLKLSVEENAGLTGNERYLWPPSEVSGELKITADPVVTVDTVYFGDQEGNLYAVDRFSGDVLWMWRTGVGISAPPAVVDGVLFIAGGDGVITAVGAGEALEGAD